MTDVTHSNLLYKMDENIIWSRLCCRLAKKSIVQLDEKIFYRLTITLLSECSVLAGGDKLHYHMEWNKGNRPFSFYCSIDITGCLCPSLSVSQPLILAVSSVLSALHHKITVRLPTPCLKTITKSDKHSFLPWNKRQSRRL